MNICDFGAILKQLRKSHNLTQVEFGLRIGLSKAVVSKYENGIGYPTFDMLIKISDYFGVTTDYLLGVAKSKTIDDRHAKPSAKSCDIIFDSSKNINTPQKKICAITLNNKDHK